MTAETRLSDRALVLLARAGLDLKVLDTEIKAAEIEAAYEQEGAA